MPACLGLAEALSAFAKDFRVPEEQIKGERENRGAVLAHVIIPGGAAAISCSIGFHSPCYN